VEQIAAREFFIGPVCLSLNMGMIGQNMGVIGQRGNLTKVEGRPHPSDFEMIGGDLRCEMSKSFGTQPGKAHACFGAGDHRFKENQFNRGRSASYAISQRPGPKRSHVHAALGALFLLQAP
jgi:hypothetical protein